MGSSKTSGVWAQLERVRIADGVLVDRVVSQLDPVRFHDHVRFGPT